MKCQPKHSEIKSSMRGKERVSEWESNNINGQRQEAEWKWEWVLVRWEWKEGVRERVVDHQDCNATGVDRISCCWCCWCSVKIIPANNKQPHPWAMSQEIPFRIPFSSCSSSLSVCPFSLYSPLSARCEVCIWKRVSALTNFVYFIPHIYLVASVWQICKFI